MKINRCFDLESFRKTNHIFINLIIITKPSGDAVDKYSHNLVRKLFVSLPKTTLHISRLIGRF